MRYRPGEPVELSLEPEDFVGKCARQNSLPSTADSGQRFQPGPRRRHRDGILSFFNPPPFNVSPESSPVQISPVTYLATAISGRSREAHAARNCIKTNNSIKTRRPHRASQLLLTACEYKLENEQRSVSPPFTPCFTMEDYKEGNVVLSVRTVRTALGAFARVGGGATDPLDAGSVVIVGELSRSSALLRPW